MNIEGGCAVSGRGTREDWEVNRFEVHSMHTHEDSIMKHTKHCLKGEENRGLGKCIGEVNLPRVLYEIFTVQLPCAVNDS
jgi:hypothetical protein